MLVYRTFKSVCYLQHKLLTMTQTIGTRYSSGELPPTWVSPVWQSSPCPPPPWYWPPAPSPPSCVECDSARSPCSYWSAQRAVPPPRTRAAEPWLCPLLRLWAAWRGSGGQSCPNRPPGSCAGPGGSYPAAGCCCLPRRFPDSARRECSAWACRCPKQQIKC
jgi:hypothetical protein